MVGPITCCASIMIDFVGGYSCKLTLDSFRIYPYSLLPSASCYYIVNFWRDKSVFECFYGVLHRGWKCPNHLSFPERTWLLKFYKSRWAESRVFSCSFSSRLWLKTLTTCTCQAHIPWVQNAESFFCVSWFCLFCSVDIYGAHTPYRESWFLAHKKECEYGRQHCR